MQIVKYCSTPAVRLIGELVEVVVYILLVLVPYLIICIKTVVTLLKPTLEAVQCDIMTVWGITKDGSLNS
jgi:uncharacterized metal-binding protein